MRISSVVLGLANTDALCGYPFNMVAAQKRGDDPRIPSIPINEFSLTKNTKTKGKLK